MKHLIVLLIFSIVPACLLKAQTADDDSRHSLLALDFNCVDVVALLQIERCTILDTIGGYTLQEVKGKMIRCYKGCTPMPQATHITYRAGVETQQQWLRTGDTMGVFLLAGKDSTGITYGWLENSGFDVTDTSFIRSITHEDTLYHKLAERLLDTAADRPLWLRARIQAMQPAYLSQSDEPRMVSLLVSETICAPGFQAGKSYTIQVEGSSYNGNHFLSKLRNGADYYFPLWKMETGEYYSQLELVLPRLSRQMAERLRCK